MMFRRGRLPLLEGGQGLIRESIKRSGKQSRSSRKQLRKNPHRSEGEDLAGHAPRAGVRTHGFFCGRLKDFAAATSGCTFRRGLFGGRSLTAAYNMSGESARKHEIEIVWERDPEAMEYVREKYRYAGTRQRPVPKKGIAGERVGYTVLADDAPNVYPGQFRRRYFFLKDHDRPQGGDVYETGTPAEGVDPLTVEPGKPGEKTPRARGESE